MRGVRGALLVALASVLLVGCGSSTANKSDPTRSTVANRQVVERTQAPKLTVIHSRFGRILSDGHGRALYLFTADRGGASSCSGACATRWPPYIVKSKPSAGAGAKGRLIDTTRGADGRLQATYRGHPLYYYEGDRSPREVNCQAALEFGGYWYVLRPTGEALR